MGSKGETMSAVVYYLSIVIAAVSAAYYIIVCFQSSCREQKILQILATCNALLCISDAVMVISKHSYTCEGFLYVSYFGGAYMGFVYILLVSVLVHAELKPWLKYFLLSVDTFFVLAALTNNKHHLMYQYVDFIPTDFATKRNLIFGPLFYAYMVWYFMLTFFPICIFSYCAMKRAVIFKSLKKCIAAFALAGFISVSTFLISGLFNLDYDISAVGSCFGSITLLALIYYFRAAPMQQNTEEAVLNSVEDVIVAVDNDGALVYANAKAKMMYDHDDVFVYGVSLNHIYEPLDAFLDLKKDEKIDIGGFHYICEILDITDSKGNCIGHTHWLKDISKETALLKEANVLKQKAEAANEAKSRFLAQMSHEIRTPMNAVLGMNELIMRESTSEDILAYSETIRRNGKSLLTLIGDILDFSKIEAGKLDIFPAKYDVSVTIKDLLDATRVRASSKSLEVRCEVDPKLPRYLVGDEVRVKQIVSNILTNAVKYTEKGYVSLTVFEMDRQNGEVTLCFDVEDTGMGIRKDQIPKLFDSFERLGNNGNYSTEGVGLGMNITRGLLERMKGTVTVESEYQKGSLFHIRIPQGFVGEA